ncbi:hypothetical protein KQI86_01635 [Clostridium sp. MSJ-11]|uniref:Uncharacterized protein n=1 Tax=Clostridium mobile TaxID=2841512 RepID=A0ABS6ECT2_9CLOT|nr:hypothetical protein [Clostridium mobile]MBU5483008.1 hypothetical protein [Clostridium mobile]
MYCKYFYPIMPYFSPMMNMYYPNEPYNNQYEMVRMDEEENEPFHIKIKKVSIEELQD